MIRQTFYDIFTFISIVQIDCISKSKLFREASTRLKGEMIYSKNSKHINLAFKIEPEHVVNLHTKDSP